MCFTFVHFLGEPPAPSQCVVANERHNALLLNLVEIRDWYAPQRVDADMPFAFPDGDECIRDGAVQDSCTNFERDSLIEPDPVKILVAD